MREFGPVRKGLTGDDADPAAAEAAAPYIGLARTILGQLKNRMQLGGIDHLSRTVNLPDGATIQVTSTNGRDTIRINAATVPTPTEEQTQEVEVSETKTVPQFPTQKNEVNTEIVLSGGFPATWWSANTGPLLTDAGVALSGLSDSGDIGCGYNGFQITRWSRTGKTTFIPSGVSVASSPKISGDGNAIAWGGLDVHGNALGFLWTKQSGLMAFAPGFFPEVISADGRVVAGINFHGNIFEGQWAAYWTAAGGLVELPAPNYEHNSSGDPVPLAGITGVSRHGEIFSGFFGKGPGDATGPTVAAIWNGNSGPVELGGLTGNGCNTAYISTDGSTVVGAYASDPTTKTYDTPYYWTRKTGALRLPSFGQASAQAVSQNGSVIAGFDGSGNIGYWIRNTGRWVKVSGKTTTFTGQALIVRTKTISGVDVPI
jgi:hypothetical protein